MTVQVDWGNVLLVPIVIAVICIPYLISYYRSRKERGFMQRIAETLGFSYQQNGDAKASNAKGLSGGQIYDVISGTHNDIPVAAFTYRVLTGGKNKYWSYMTVFETPVQISLPDIVLQPNEFDLDAAANMALTRTSLFGGYETVSLEGDFGKYFILHVAKGAHVEALEILTPDIMADMIDHFRSYGLEFSNDTLYLYPMKLLTDDDTFMQALGLLERLAKNLRPNLDAMSASTATQPQTTRDITQQQ
jgi:hypothetical protein